MYATELSFGLVSSKNPIPMSWPILRNWLIGFAISCGLFWLVRLAREVRKHLNVQPNWSTLSPRQRESTEAGPPATPRERWRVGTVGANGQGVRTLPPGEKNVVSKCSSLEPNVRFRDLFRRQEPSTCSGLARCCPSIHFAAMPPPAFASARSSAAFGQRQPKCSRCVRTTSSVLRVRA